MMLLIVSRHVKYVSFDCTPLVSIFLAGALLPFVVLPHTDLTSPTCYRSHYHFNIFSLLLGPDAKQRTRILLLAGVKCFLLIKMRFDDESREEEEKRGEL